MIRAKRENLIALPVMAGLLWEWVLWTWVTGAESWQNEYLIDTRGKLAIFIMAFLLFWTVVPRSKRLVAFMLVLLGSCALNVLFLWPPTYHMYYDQLAAIRFSEVMGFSKIYRAVEAFVLFAWLGGIKDNVYYIICRARLHGSRARSMFDRNKEPRT